MRPAGSFSVGRIEHSSELHVRKMPIHSTSELRVALTNETPWLTPKQVDETVAKSCFQSGQLVAVYAKFLRNSPAPELAAFLHVAGAYLAGIGGDPNGPPVQK